MEFLEPQQAFFTLLLNTGRTVESLVHERRQNMLVLGLGALIAALGVGVTLATPMIAISHAHRAHALEQAAEEERELVAA
jgi:hypothetical protein